MTMSGLAVKAVAALTALAAAVSVAADSNASRPPVVFVASSQGTIVLLTGTGNVVKTFGHGESPAFSTDGSRIAFIRDGDVFMIGIDGRGLTRVTRTEAREESPDWSPDGSLVYASDRGGQLELYVQKPGARPRQITDPSQRWQEDRSPAWSPDGRWIAFASNRPGNFNQELYLVRPNGSGLKRLTFTSGSDTVLGDDGMPTWRPDGSGLVFVSNRDRNFELYALELKTGKTTRLTRTTDRDEALPRIGPDGRYAFVVQPPRGGGSRIAVADAALRGRRAIQSGTAVDWRL